jgi:hypothetical protein
MRESTVSRNGEEANRSGEPGSFSSVMAPVGRKTVTMGFHRISLMLGRGMPHSRHPDKSAGLAVPQDEQYTVFNIFPQ